MIKFTDLENIEPSRMRHIQYSYVDIDSRKTDFIRIVRELTRLLKNYLLYIFRVLRSTDCFVSTS